MAGINQEAEDLTWIMWVGASGWEGNTKNISSFEQQKVGFTGALLERIGVSPARGNRAPDSDRGADFL